MISELSIDLPVINYQLNLFNNYILFFIVLSILYCIYYCSYNIFKGKKASKLPPMAPTSLYQNIIAITGQDFKPLLYVQHLTKLMSELKSSENKSTGTTFRVSMPQLQPFLFTTDYKLSKLLLSGSQEAEKPTFMQSINVINRNVNSILSHPTNNEDRAKARKALAPAFSTSNLQTTWKELRLILSAQLDYLSQLSLTETSFDFKALSWKLFLSSIATSGLGVDISFDGHDDENTIDGLKYMEESDIAVQERSNELLIPFRRWHFWDPSVARGKQACLIMKKEMEKIAALHRGKGGSIEATAPRRSIIDHLMGHNYPSEEALLTDLWLMILAAHETSASSLCFILMELAKNPSVKSKLRSELATFMPDQPSLIDLSQQQSSNLLSVIANCQYLTNCIQEGMRLWPAAAGGPMRALDKDVHYDGMMIPAGSIVNVHFFSMFRSDWITNAETYDPDRWLDNNLQLPQLKEMFIPFSAGKRNCIGQNMAMLQLRVITAYFIRYFDFELVEEPVKEFFLTLKPASMMMKVRKVY